jgi:hypothetical protein
MSERPRIRTAGAGACANASAMSASNRDSSNRLSATPRLRSDDKRADHMGHHNQGPRAADIGPWSRPGPCRPPAGKLSSVSGTRLATWRRQHDMILPVLYSQSQYVFDVMSARSQGRYIGFGGLIGLCSFLSVSTRLGSPATARSIASHRPVGARRSDRMSGTPRRAGITPPRTCSADRRVNPYQSPLAAATAHPLRWRGAGASAGFRQSCGGFACVADPSPRPRPLEGIHLPPHAGPSQDAPTIDSEDPRA